MNALALVVNGNQMPVLTPGACGADTFESVIHVCMTRATHLKVLCDWIFIRGDGVYSPGDFLEMAFDNTQIPALIVWVVLMVRKYQS